MPETHEAGDIHYGCDDEPAMHIQRPSSARSQDVTHILVRTFRELFTRDTIAPDVVQYLNTSRCSDDEYHKQYVDSLMKVQMEHTQRLAEFDMLERHIMQAQARAVSSDEREAHRLYAVVKDAYPDVYMPPVHNHFRSCIDSELLKQHNLISPDDFSSVRVPVVPPPAAPNVPHFAQDVSSKRNSPASQRIPQKHNGAAKSHSRQWRQKSLPKLELLWKHQLSGIDRASLRNDLSKLQSKVDYLKNDCFIPPSTRCCQSATRTLVHADKGIPKEIGIRSIAIADSCEAIQTFLASPPAVRFTNYEAGLVYEMSLELMNVSSVMRPVRVIPPQTPYFSVSLGQFPSLTSQVAPGLSCIYHIRFSPDALCDFNDVLAVETVSSPPLRIPLSARREPPALSLPECLDVGHCVVGGVKVGRLCVKNKGGSGRFCLIPTDDWPNASLKTVSAVNAIRFGHTFEVKPVLFQVASDQSATLYVMFTPPACGEFSQQLTILCDNCHVRHITITGKGVKPSVELISVPECPLSAPAVGELCDISAQHFLRFPPLNPCTYTQRRITVNNCV